MKAQQSFGPSVTIYQSTRRNIPEDLKAQELRCENLKHRSVTPAYLTPSLHANGHAISTSTTFLGLILDNTFSWKSHIDWLMSKLSSACYVIRAVKPYVT
jgi:hypothetical protein